MARRQKKPARVRAAAVDADTPRRTVERFIEKGNVKEAFKQAKFFFHQDASPENRQLVERTYLLRIQSLIRGGMPSTGREVAGNLLEFGVTDPALMEELILLLPRVGLADKALALQSRVQAPEFQARLLTKLADQAVLHPEEILSSLPELREAAGQVRLALAALDADNDAQALQLLQGIPRSSPLADWRYFVRGLAAFRLADLVQARANWERLDPQRAAQKIAAALLATSNPASPVDNLGGQPGDHPDHLRALEASTFGEPVLERITDLRGALEAADWKRAPLLAGPLRKTLHRIDPSYARRLTEILLPPLSVEIMRQSDDDAERMIKDFQAALEPLPSDPRWNRFQAILWEGPQGSDEEAADYWQLYVHDLSQGTAIPAGDPRQVQALVWRRLGEIYSSLANDEEYDAYEDDPEEEDDEPHELRDEAIRALRESLRSDPRQRKTYEILVEQYRLDGQPDLLLATLEDLQKAFPDDIDALRQLIHEHQLRDEPEAVLRYNERVRLLAPLDTGTFLDETWGRLALARHLALKQRWEEGRAEVDRVETSLKKVPPVRLLTRRAAFEYKAGDDKRAEGYIKQARALQKEPAVPWLSLAIEAIRYQLSKAHQKWFIEEFNAVVVGKATGVTAGELAELMLGYLTGQVEYTGRAGHLHEIVEYIRRTTRLKYREPDLRHVCNLLQFLDNEPKLLATLAKRGSTLFPKSPFFIQLEVELEMSKGLFGFKVQRSRTKLEQALAAAQASRDAQDAPLIPVIKETLARVQDLGEAMSSLPFSPRGMPGDAGRMPGGMPSSPQEFQDLFESLFNCLGDLESDSDDGDSGPDRTRRSPRRKSR